MGNRALRQMLLPPFEMASPRSADAAIRLARGRMSGPKRPRASSQAFAFVFLATGAALAFVLAAGFLAGAFLAGAFAFAAAFGAAFAFAAALGFAFAAVSFFGAAFLAVLAGIAMGTPLR